jgi:hypothetical protein
MTRLYAVAALVLMVTPAMAQDVSYQVINDTSLALLEFHTDPASTGDMTDNDRLGAESLRAGEAATITIDDGSGECLYVFRIVLEDGVERVDTHDICATSSYTVTE